MRDTRLAMPKAEALTGTGKTSWNEANEAKELPITSVDSLVSDWFGRLVGRLVWLVWIEVLPKHPFGFPFDVSSHMFRFFSGVHSKNFWICLRAVDLPFKYPSQQHRLSVSMLEGHGSKAKTPNP